MNVIDLAKFMQGNRLFVLAHGTLGVPAISVLFDLLTSGVCSPIKLTPTSSKEELERTISELDSTIPVVFVVGGGADLWTGRFWQDLVTYSDTVLLLNAEGQTSIHKDPVLSVDTQIDLLHFLRDLGE